METVYLFFAEGSEEVEALIFCVVQEWKPVSFR